MDNERLSVIIIDHDDTEELEKIVRERYAPADGTSVGEVVAVVGKGKREADDLLERLQPLVPMLRTTFVPDSSRRVDRRKLALTLGIKAAKNDQIIIIDLLCPSFSAFRRFANRQHHRRLTRKTGSGIGFDNDADALGLSKQLFLQRDSFDANIDFLCQCYDSPALLRHGMWLIRLKYVLAKCHLYKF